MYAGKIFAYLYVPALEYGAYIPPTCAARSSIEGPDAFPCELNRLGAWLIRFSNGLRGEELGTFEQYWKALAWEIGTVLMVLITGALLSLWLGLLRRKENRQKNTDPEDQESARGLLYAHHAQV